MRLREKVQALSRPETYPDRPRRVERIETHMSFVFLTERFAYKLKKPVRYHFLDFSRLEARRGYCRDEVDLNRPLAGDVYLGVVALTREADGSLRVGGSGVAVDWLVKTRRLPADRMLDRALRDGTARDAEIAAVIARLAEFYAAAERVGIDADAYVARLRADLAENLDALEDPEYGLPADSVAQVRRVTSRMLDRETGLFAERARAHRIVDGHGDLRPEHVVLEDPPKVIDRLEFNASFRHLDPLDELAYLAMECEQLGFPDAGALALRTYADLSGDPAPDRLVLFYKCFRACLRAKLAAWHTGEPRANGRERWLAAARAYLDLACGYASTLA